MPTNPVQSRPAALEAEEDADEEMGLLGRADAATAVPTATTVPVTRATPYRKTPNKMGFEDRATRSEALSALADGRLAATFTGNSFGSKALRMELTNKSPETLNLVFVRFPCPISRVCESSLPHLTFGGIVYLLPMRRTAGRFSATGQAASSR
mmetsp:Transcript_59369/g.134392  ORF Transcript_59369/g.134392 Transcript_59369/m.134392 type:complete len:153 (-) Transcript_59369:546-1004(-)